MTYTQYDQRDACCWMGLQWNDESNDLASRYCLDAPDLLTGSTQCSPFESGHAAASCIYFQR